MLPSAAGLGSVAGGSDGVTWGTGSYFFSTGLGFSTDSVLYHNTGFRRFNKGEKDAFIYLRGSKYTTGVVSLHQTVKLQGAQSQFLFPWYGVE